LLLSPAQLFMDTRLVLRIAKFFSK